MQNISTNNNVNLEKLKTLCNEIQNDFDKLCASIESKQIRPIQTKEISDTHIKIFVSVLQSGISPNKRMREKDIFLPLDLFNIKSITKQEKIDSIVKLTKITPDILNKIDDNTLDEISKKYDDKKYLFDDKKIIDFLITIFEHKINKTGVTSVALQCQNREDNIFYQKYYKNQWEISTNLKLFQSWQWEPKIKFVLQ